MRRYTLLRILPLVLVALALVALGRWLVPQLRSPQGKTYRFYVEDATGLPEGTEVKFHGVVVGQVTSVALDEARSQERKSPWFEVGFQPDPAGERVLRLWSFHAVTLDKETPFVGATVVTLADAAMPGDATPDELTLRVTQGDALSGDLHEITTGIKQVVANANAAMLDLKKELEARPEGSFDPSRPTRLAAVLGSVQDAAHQLAVVSDHLSTITDVKGPVTVALGKVGALTDDLKDETRPFLSTFVDLKKTSLQLRGDMVRASQVLDTMAPALERTTANAAQMTDTLKREPWRIIWKSTKEYGDATATGTPPAPSPTPGPTRRKRTAAR